MKEHVAVFTPQVGNAFSLYLAMIESLSNSIISIKPVVVTPGYPVGLDLIANINRNCNIFFGLTELTYSYSALDRRHVSDPLKFLIADQEFMQCAGNH